MPHCRTSHLLITSFPVNHICLCLTTFWLLDAKVGHLDLGSTNDLADSQCSSNLFISRRFWVQILILPVIIEKHLIHDFVCLGAHLARLANRERTSHHRGFWKSRAALECNMSSETQSWKSLTNKEHWSYKLPTPEASIALYVLWSLAQWYPRSKSRTTMSRRWLSRSGHGPRPASISCHCNLLNNVGTSNFDGLKTFHVQDFWHLEDRHSCRYQR